MDQRIEEQVHVRALAAKVVRELGGFGGGDSGGAAHGQRARVSFSVGAARV